MRTSDNDFTEVTFDTETALFTFIDPAGDAATMTLGITKSFVSTTLNIGSAIVSIDLNGTPTGAAGASAIIPFSSVLPIAPIISINIA